MRRLGIAALCLAGTCLATPASAGGPVQPDQHFAGRVNGVGKDAVVTVVCAGPAGGDRTGHPASGQTWSVVRRAGGTGYTGYFSQIYAWFVPTNGETPRHRVFYHYRRTKSIPQKADVPCDGTGHVEFSSCPYLAPCAAGWQPTYVDVRFVNIAD
jgi:hypothetical protein